MRKLVVTVFNHSLDGLRSTSGIVDLTYRRTDS
jgi:hypothetical protein